jgi:DNA-binding MarR family transcriptional regulator
MVYRRHDVTPPTPRQQDALDRLLHVSALLEADQARFHAERDMTGPRVHLLWQVGLTGPTTQRVVADALGVTPRAVTGLVDGLEASGHVTRQPDPGDRRAALVTLTPAGERFVADLRESHARLAEDLFGRLDDDRLGTFVDVLDATVARVAELMDELAEEGR